jgi:hypothetical protein
MDRYISVKEYAALQGLKGTSGVYNRINRGALKTVKLNGLILVDTQSYTPGKAGRPKKAA